MDQKGGKIPSMGTGLIAATPSCIVIGTLCFADGETEIVLTDEDVSDPKLNLEFDGFLATPSLNLIVVSTVAQVLLTVKVTKSRTHLQIFVNDESEPDDIRVVIRDGKSRTKPKKK